MLLFDNFKKDNNRHAGRVRLRRMRSGIQVKAMHLDSGYPPAADSGMTEQVISPLVGNSTTR
jgi:hypothetical protein